MPELRKDPIIGRWVIISTERAQRPQDLRQAIEISETSHCPFCEGNESKTPPEVYALRQQGSRPNGPGWTLRTVANKFPALQIEGDLRRRGEGLYDRMSGIGAHEVIIETPHHDGTMSNLPIDRVADIFWAFRERVEDLKRDRRFKYALIFKNHGRQAGASLNHPHSQIIAMPIVPKRVLEEMQGAKAYYQYRERCIYCDIITQELEDKERMILETEYFVALSPFAPRFPFETWILPKNHCSEFEAIDRKEAKDLAGITGDLLRRLDIVLERPAFNFLIHTVPFHSPAKRSFHWHLELMPKVTRIAGFEWGTGFYINPTPPEEAAHFLKEVKPRAKADQ